MRHETLSRAGMAAALAMLVLPIPALAQYREYYVRGRVLDTQKQPIPGVEIEIRDVETSRSYHMKTAKDGTFKFAGLPHGVYEASITKEGYPPTKVEWKFEAPQDTMQRADIPDIVLASQEQVQKVERFKQAESGVKEAAEKLRKGDLDGAITVLKGVLDNNPRDASALFFIGLSYAGKKMYREAIDALTQVAELNPTFPGVYFELGVCYRQLGDLPKALESYDKSLQQDPANATSAYNSGLILFETNRIDEAFGRFQQALALKPADPDVLEMTGRCYIHQGKWAAAVEHLEKARAATSDSAKTAFLDQLIATAKGQIR